MVICLILFILDHLSWLILVKHERQNNNLE